MNLRKVLLTVQPPVLRAGQRLVASRTQGPVLALANRVHRLPYVAHDGVATEHDLLLCSGTCSRADWMYGSHMPIAIASMPCSLALAQLDNLSLSLPAVELGANIDVIAITAVGIDGRLARCGFKRVASAVSGSLARFTMERTFAWEDKFKRLLLRFETLQIRHLGFKLMAFTLINLREFCGA